jgi:hypothetical protein
MWKMFSNVPQVIAELLDQSFLTKPVDLARFGSFGLKNNKIKDDESFLSVRNLGGLAPRSDGIFPFLTFKLLVTHL